MLSDLRSKNQLPTALCQRSSLQRHRQKAKTIFAANGFKPPLEDSGAEPRGAKAGVDPTWGPPNSSLNAAPAATRRAAHHAPAPGVRRHPGCAGTRGAPVRRHRASPPPRTGRGRGRGGGGACGRARPLKRPRGGQVFRLPRGYFRIRWRQLGVHREAALGWREGWLAPRARPAMLGGILGAREREAECDAAGAVPAPPAIDFPAEGSDPKYDESDVPAELQLLKGPLQQPTFPFAVANQLLLVSLLEHLSHVHEPDPLRSRQVFKLLCQTFIKMGLLSSFTCSDEFSSLRLHHNRAITHLMRSAKERVRQVGTKKCTWSVIKTFSFQENCILKHSEILIIT
ncbi:uncharacterized protein [Physeter macrocephalus]|uniref:non-specific serine/threonine protein kinase n=1 Tax=Physeter macrocephalus TaxID=9755 RepID=A0A455BGJ9_PHYMC|nr:uncharacterized protein LOC114485584 [Physeter catodon]|eukprot:XP_028343086.1 uncharacterized protein LOC114485584 [Physeter catodon]